MCERFKRLFACRILAYLTLCDLPRPRPIISFGAARWRGGLLIWPSPAAVAAVVVAAVAPAQIPGIRVMTDKDVPDVTRLLNHFLGSGEAKFYPVRPPPPTFLLSVFQSTTVPLAQHVFIRVRFLYWRGLIVDRMLRIRSS